MLLEDQPAQPTAVKEALELATTACSVTEHKSPTALIVLADAYASDGQLPKAVSIARQALDLAQETGRPNLRARIGNMLSGVLRQLNSQPAPGR